MITNIKLRNWKSHLDSDLSFSRGVNALIGIMGSGKSSIVQGICFALYGTFPGLQSRRLEIDDLIMKKPQEKNHASVELKFVIDGKEYFIRRLIKTGKGTSEAEIREDGKLLDVNPQGVTRQVERILQMDYDLFSKAVYSEQDGLDYFLRIPKGQRIQHIDRMLKVDRFEKARENSVSIKNKMKTIREEKIKFVSDLGKEGFEEKIKGLSFEIKDLDKKSETMKSDVEKIKKERDSLLKKVSEFEKMENEMNSTKQKLEGVNSGIKEIDENLKNKMEKIGGVDAESLSEKIKKIDLEVKNLESDLEIKDESVREKTEDVASLNSRILILEKKEIPKIRSALEEKKGDKKIFHELEKKLGPQPDKILKAKTKEFEKCQKDLLTLKAESEDVLRVLEDMKKVKDKCPVCESKISAEKMGKLIETKKNRIKKLDDQIRIENKKLEGLESGLEETKNEIDDFKLLKERLKDFEKLEKELKDSVEEVVLNREKVNSKIKVLQEMKKTKVETEKKLMDKKIDNEKLEMVLTEIKEIDVLKVKKSEYFERKSVLENKINELEKEFGEVKIGELREELQEKIANEREIMRDIVNSEMIIKEKMERLSELEEKQKMLKEYKESVKHLELTMDDLDKFIDTLNLTQNQLREEFLKTVNSIMNKIWGELYPYPDFSEIRLMIDKDYVLQLKGSRGWVSVEGIVSGGERSLASLALRIAFSLAFTPNLRWMILDEPTHNLDANAIQHFGDILRDKLGYFAEQVFLITHEEKLSDSIGGSVYKLERDKENDGVTKVLEL
jgi:exonuclease SbcC